MIVFGVLLSLLTVLIFIWYMQRKRMHQFFKNIGVSGPSPSILFGNVHEMANGTHDQWEAWRKIYGKTYGYFEGPKPVLVTSDVTLLKQIFVSDFNRFSSRKPFPLQDEHDKFIEVFTAKGKSWKRLRSICSPSFSTRRMKEMTPLLNDTISQILDCFKKKCEAGKPFDIYGDFQRMTLTAIASCAFGIEINPIKDPQDVFLERTRKMFSFTEKKNRPFLLTYVIIPFAICFPSVFQVIWRFVMPHIDQPKTWFLNIAKKILQHRMEVESDRIDFLKLMLDANEVEITNEEDLTMSLDDKDVIDNADSQGKTSVSSPGKPRSTDKTMTMEEMQSQCMLFLLAGYETTSTALGFLAHTLAIRPDIQQKLREEIDRHFPDKIPDDVMYPKVLAHGRSDNSQHKEVEPDYSSVQNLPYMDMLIYEVLRMYPIAQIATTRVATEDSVIAGQEIPKGLAIQAHMEALHFDPELWGPEDPNECIPERFLPERKSRRDITAWMPFGLGPRNCVGMRFGLLEIKLTLSRLLRRFTIMKCEETQVPLPVNKLVVKSPSEGVYVRLLQRD